MVLRPSTNGTRTSPMTKRKINPYAEFILPCSSVDRTVYVTSSSNFHGLWGLWCKVEGMSEQDRQDVCEALLEEIFFCGYDFYDDWYPVLSRIRSADVRSWLLGTRDGILSPAIPLRSFSQALRLGSILVMCGLRICRRRCAQPRLRSEWRLTGYLVQALQLVLSVGGNTFFPIRAFIVLLSIFFCSLGVWRRRIYKRSTFRLGRLRPCARWRSVIL